MPVPEGYLAYSVGYGTIHLVTPDNRTRTLCGRNVPPSGHEVANYDTVWDCQRCWVSYNRREEEKATA